MRERRREGGRKGESEGEKEERGIGGREGGRREREIGGREGGRRERGRVEGVRTEGRENPLTCGNPMS